MEPIVSEKGKSRAAGNTDSPRESRMNEKLNRLLTYLQENLDPKKLSAIDDLTCRAVTWQEVERLPIILSYPINGEGLFEAYPHHEVFDDPEKMLYNELVSAFETHIAEKSRIEDDLPCTVRANFGTVAIASQFGGNVEQLEDNPPWINNDDIFDIYEVFRDRDPLDFDHGWCPRYAERYLFYEQTLKEYPPLDRIVKRVLPDLQGPIDTAELLRGSGIFLDIYDRPDELQDLLNTVTTAQIGFARYLQSHVTDGPEGFSHQHGSMFPGGVLIRNDTSIMLSPEMYRDNISVHDARVLNELGGGGVHSCGNIMHLVSEYLELPNIHSLDLGNPDMNDLDSMYERAREKQTALVRISVPEQEVTSGAVLDRFPTGMVLFQKAPSQKEARRILDSYLEAAAGR